MFSFLTYQSCDLFVANGLLSCNRVPPRFYQKSREESGGKRAYMEFEPKTLNQNTVCLVRQPTGKCANGKFDSTAILKSWEKLGTSDKWSHFSEFPASQSCTQSLCQRALTRWPKSPRTLGTRLPASKDGGTKGKEYRVLFLSKNVFFYAHQCSIFKFLIT